MKADGLPDSFHDLMILPEGGHSSTDRYRRYCYGAMFRDFVEHLDPALGGER